MESVNFNKNFVFAYDMVDTSTGEVFLTGRKKLSIVDEKTFDVFIKRFIRSLHECPEKEITFRIVPQVDELTLPFF